MTTTADPKAYDQLGGGAQLVRQMFEQAPTFMTMLRGREHRIEMANSRYLQLVGNRPVVGRTVAEALPESIDQGFVALLDRVFDTGEAFRADGYRFVSQVEPNGPADERFLDFVYQPIRGDDGAVIGIFVEGLDVTARVRANAFRDALFEISERFRADPTPDEMAFATAEVVGRTLGVSRAGYGEVDTRAETITIARDWNAPGIRSLAGVLNFRAYGTYIEDLKRGETVIFSDAREDPRTRDTADALIAISARAVINMPVSEEGGFVALLYLNQAEPREWTSEELEFIREAADRTRQAVERRKAEQRLAELAASLERQIEERTRELRESEAALRRRRRWRPWVSLPAASPTTSTTCSPA